MKTLEVGRLGRSYSVLLNARDFAWASRHRWYINRDGYVARNGKMVAGVRAPATLLHREVMGCVPGDGLVVDHINHNTLDNRRRNLRVVDHAANMQNLSSHRDSKSRHRGVHFCTRHGVWKASHMYRGVRWSKTCKSEAEAAAAVAARRAAVLGG